MLILNLTAVARGPVSVRGELSPDDPIWAGTGLELKEPLTAELEAREVGEGVLVRGEIATRLVAECRRCLKPVPLDVRDRVDLLFEPLEGEEAADLEGEVYALPERGDQLDLSEALREQVLTLIPEFVVCAESCKGLCPQCGTDLNREACGCTREREPGPWDALKDIEFE
jgi:uncharacterized protein